MIKYLILVILWFLYGLIHSLFAAHRIKYAFDSRFPSLRNYYRLIYVTFAFIGLGIIAIYMVRMPDRYLFVQSVWTVFGGLGLAAAGILFVFIAFRSYDLSEFIGTRQLAGDYSAGTFKQDGLLKYVRHPLYTGSILSVIGFEIFAPTISMLITSVCLIIYFAVGIRFEEKKLIREFGEPYVRYKEKVPALIPSWDIFNVFIKTPKKK